MRKKPRNLLAMEFPPIDDEELQIPIPTSQMPTILSHTESYKKKERKHSN